jgi:thiol:disulfide interchange protein
LSLAVLPVLAPLSATGDWDAALAGLLAVGITLIGGLAFGRRWWPLYTLLAASVLLVLLLAPDAYVAFGLAFDLVVVAALARALLRQRRHKEQVAASR